MRAQGPVLTVLLLLATLVTAHAQMGSPGGGETQAIALHPTNPQIIYVGAAEWVEKNHGLLDKVVRCMVVDPNNPATLWVGTWHGIYRSEDGGDTWRANPDGLYDVDVRALALDPTDSRILYAGTHPRGVFRSEDGGWTWKKASQPLSEEILAVVVDPSNPARVFAGTRAGVFRSENRGDRFEGAGLSWSNRTWTLVFDERTSPPTLYYGGEGGVLKTTNSGR